MKLYVKTTTWNRSNYTNYNDLLNDYDLVGIISSDQVMVKRNGSVYIFSEGIK